jgi:hypothetical protein
LPLRSAPWISAPSSSSTLSKPMSKRMKTSGQIHDGVRDCKPPTVDGLPRLENNVDRDEARVYRDDARVIAIGGRQLETIRLLVLVGTT